ncbi:MAG: hypothetical protein CGW95_05365 [Phenylobacterium zucineum]|nr:MAG: hypothetical protein CGW95_05365 [Phenylobacterium zucineum]
MIEPSQFDRPSFKAALVTSGWVFLFSLPATSGHIQRLIRGGHWFHDYEAMACAGQRALGGGLIYDLNLACTGMQATPYVYPPITAHVFAGLERAIGITATAGMYGALYWAAAAFMLSTTLLGVRTQGSLRDRAPYLALISGSALFSGNVATLVHGAVGAAALLLTTNIWAISLIIAMAAMIKPVFLTYLAILMFARQPLWKRAGAIILATTLGLAPTAWFLLTDPAGAEAWRVLLTHFLIESNGFSFSGGSASWVAIFAMGWSFQSTWFLLRRSCWPGW